MSKFRAGFIGLVSLMLAAPAAFAAAAVDVPVIDMREATPQQAREKAQQMSENGMAILYLGASDPTARTVQTVAGECAEAGFQVRALILAHPESDGEGVLLFGATSGPLGPTIPVSGDLKSETKAQVATLKQRLASNPTGMAAVDPLDVVKCRSIPVVGSRVRKERVCTTPRQDAEAAEQNKSWTKRMQDRGGNEAMPGQG
jgi:hypothetical protein